MFCRVALFVASGRASKQRNRQVKHDKQFGMIRYSGEMASTEQTKKRRVELYMLSFGMITNAASFSLSLDDDDSVA